MQEAEIGAARKVFDLKLPELGPYNLAFTRSGAHLLLGGRKGHLALMDWQQRHLVCEVQVPGTFTCPDCQCQQWSDAELLPAPTPEVARWLMSSMEGAIARVV